MVKPGIIDPTKVARPALHHTASVGSLIDHRGGDGGRAAGVIRCRQWVGLPSKACDDPARAPLYAHRRGGSDGG
jgi:hypothetical protein